MDVSYQVMDQMLQNTGVSKAQAPSKPTKSKGSEKSDFDRMVQQKRQESSPQGASQKPKAQEKGAPQAQQTQEEGVGQEQYMMAAAMMLQIPQETVDVEVVEEVELLPQEQQVQVVELVQEPQAVQEEAPQVQQQVEAAPEQRQEVAPEQHTQVQHEAVHQVRQERVQQTGPVEQQAQTEEEEESAPQEQLTQNAPVFGEQRAVPVRVSAGESAPVPLESERGMEQLSQRIEEFLVNDASQDRVEITLSPASLGRVTVEITRGEDGALHILLSATTQRAASLLERGANGLQNLLASPNRPSVDVEVRTAQPSTQQQFLNPNGQEGHQQQRQQQGERREQRQHREHPQDFIQRLRLGLVELE